MQSGDRDRVQLEDSLSHLFSEFFGHVLTYMEVALPHLSGQSSDNEIKFRLIRSKVLGEGNDDIRKMKLLLKAYWVKKLYEQETLVAKFPGRGVK